MALAVPVPRGPTRASRPGDERGIFLSTLPAGREEHRLALAVVLVSVAIFLAAAPFAKERLAQVPAFIPVYQSALVVNDLITAVLLFGQFSILRSRALLVLASGYLFSGLMAISHALSFPGLFAPTGLLGAGPQTTAWLYFLWHGGFPLVVIAYAMLKDEGPETGRLRGSPRVAVLSSVATVLVVAGGLTLLTTAGHDAFPAIMQGNRDAPAKVIVASASWMLSLIALPVLWRRRPHSVLDLWLMVVMCVWIFDIALASVLNAGRYDLGWYAGRIYGLLAASFVLLVLLLENGVLYARVVEAHDGERQERRRAQRAEEAAAAANRAKSDFLSRMSHELRTPLNGIIGFAQVLDMELHPPEQRESVDHILKGGRHLLSLINEVLDIARIESGKVTISLEPVLVSDVVRAALDMIRPQAIPRRVQVIETMSAHEYVTADRQRLQQVVLNLLSNAVKYNREGGVVRVACEGGVAGRLRLIVADTGPGIAAEMMSRLFTPFDRLGAEQTTIEGTGLGLALSHHLVAAMGGTLSATSTVGQGTTFTVELRRAEVLPVESGSPGRVDAHVADPAGTRGTVLYIEDNVANLRLLERIMTRRPGVKLLSAMQGTRGIELARDHRPDLILLDLHLPDLPGSDVLARLAADPRTEAIPVVILSADATPGQIRRLLEQGAREYLTKPLDVKQMLALVDNTLINVEA
jgi:signal transduction histidine kinase/CheY-like chemotaxis protein